MKWQAFFKEHGNEYVDSPLVTLTFEELYEAFRERMRAELYVTLSNSDSNSGLQLKDS